MGACKEIKSERFVSTKYINNGNTLRVEAPTANPTVTDTTKPVKADFFIISEELNLDLSNPIKAVQKIGSCRWENRTIEAVELALGSSVIILGLKELGNGLNSSQRFEEILGALAIITGVGCISAAINRAVKDAKLLDFAQESVQNWHATFNKASVLIARIHNKKTCLNSQVSTEGDNS